MTKTRPSSPLDDSSASLAPIRDGLVAWYLIHRRDLPWRRRPTPYRVWVSEIMLQQTRVDVVIPYFERFVRAFPSIAKLASASVEEVLEAWSGLGYYRRARQLHAGASYLLRHSNGCFPRSIADALEIPGVGRYTAGAILSIAYGERAPILDGNVIRVFARLFGIEGDPARATIRSRMWSFAERMVEEGDPSTVNQSMMELGALVCLPRGARCTDCPLRSICVARRDGLVERLPARSATRAKVDVTCAALVVRRGNEVLLRRRGDEELLPGLWDLPGTFRGVDGDRGRPLEDVVADLPVAVEIGALLGVLRHHITYRKIKLEITEARARSERFRAEDHRWCTLGEAERLALSAPARKILARWGASNGPPLS